MVCASIVERDAANVVLSVGVISSLKLSCACKGSVVRVPASNNRLNWLEYSETLSTRQLSVCSSLKLSKKLILLWRFNVVDDADKHAQRPVYTPLAQERLLSIELLSSVVVCLSILAKYNCLADEIERVRAAAEASMSRVKVVYASERGGLQCRYS